MLSGLKQRRHWTLIKSNYPGNWRNEWGEEETWRASPASGDRGGAGKTTVKERVLHLLLWTLVGLGHLAERIWKSESELPPSLSPAAAELKPKLIPDARSHMKVSWHVKVGQGQDGTDAFPPLWDLLGLKEKKRSPSSECSLRYWVRLELILSADIGPPRIYLHCSHLRK